MKYLEFLSSIDNETELVRVALKVIEVVRLYSKIPDQSSVSIQTSLQLDKIETSLKEEINSDQPNTDTIHSLQKAIWKLV